MKRSLKELFEQTSWLDWKGKDVEVASIQFDSRKIKSGDVFVAVPGTQVDGHMFIDKAIEQGATGVILERYPEKMKEGVTYVKVTNSAEVLSHIASAYYDHPSRQIKLVGVTGTNGKTTTVTLLYDLFQGLGYKCGLLSTVENKIDREVRAASHTTPDAVAVNQLLADIVDAQCDYAFMEVSSHAVDQKRTSGLYFSGGVFTNMSHDHLDYHKTFKAYIEAKKAFFDQLGKNAFALVNIDDKRGTVMIQNTEAKKHTYAKRNMTDFKVRLLENAISGLHLEINGQEVHSRLIGEFNAYNLTAVYGTAMLLEQDPIEVLTVMSQLKAAEGRFDYIQDDEGKAGIVDYAHTPDALEKILETINELKSPLSKVITVVGCGGDRDRKKRPVMAQIAVAGSDLAILTSDNPRTEDPDFIISEMEAGLNKDQLKQTLTISNRRSAIKTAVKMATSKDIVLVAGKGHEKYQEINGVRHPFDDKAELIAAMS